MALYACCGTTPLPSNLSCCDRLISKSVTHPTGNPIIYSTNVAFNLLFISNGFGVLCNRISDCELNLLPNLCVGLSPCCSSPLELVISEVLLRYSFLSGLSMIWLVELEIPLLARRNSLYASPLVSAIVLLHWLGSSCDCP